MAHHNESRQEVTQNDQSLGFADEKDVQGKDEELYLPEDEKIYDPKVVKRYGERIDYLRNNAFQGQLISLEQLGQACGITKQALSNIVKGKNKSVDPKQCNTLARCLKCSAWYLIGACEDRMGVLVNDKEYKMPLRQFDKQSKLNIMEAYNWDSIDPELFELVRQVFMLAPPTRQIIRDILKPLLKMASS